MSEEVNKILTETEKRILEGNSENSLQILLSLDLSRVNLDSYVKRAELFERLNMLERAEEDLTWALDAIKDIEHNKRKVQEVLIMRIRVREALEKYEEALEDNLKLIELGSDQNLVQTRQRLITAAKDAKLKSEAGEFLMIFKSNQETKPGSEWHVVSQSWFDRWQIYTSLSTYYMSEEIPFKVVSKSFVQVDSPGPIDNSDIIDSGQSDMILTDPNNDYGKICLKKGMAENLNYILLPKPAFEYLFNIHGCVKDIKRFAIEINDTMYQVEVVLKMINIAIGAKDKLDTDVMNVSSKDSIDKVKKAYMTIKSIKTPTKVWKVNLQIISLDKLQAVIKTNEVIYLEGAKVLNESVLIDDAEISEQDLIFIEVQRKNAFMFTDDSRKVSHRCTFCQCSGKLSFVCDRCKAVKYCSSACLQSHQSEHKDKCRPSKRSLLRCFCRNLNDHSDEEAQVVPIDTVPLNKSGLTGLQNLGNTCFMNAALQCLSHTNEITDVFLSGRYLEYLNKNNPLGTNGKLAMIYAELLQSLWKSGNASFAPWKIKRAISAFAPQFVGYQQHDAQELLGFILDRLHEDLNLIKKKPYIEDSEVKGKTDEEMANESWRQHTMRNKSIIVDLIHGQYKSSLYCPSCKEYSYTFDPFNSITLPLPQSKEKVLNFYYIFYDPNKAPLSMAFEYTSNTKLENLSRNIVEVLETPAQSFIFATILNDVIKEISQPQKLIESLKSFTLFAYQIKEVGEVVELQISIEKGKSRTTSYSRIICIEPNSTFKELHYEIFSKFRHFFSKYSPKLRIQEIYEEFMTAPAYSMCFIPMKDHPCQFCHERTCKGCPIPYSKEPISRLFIGSKVRIDIAWRANHSLMGANLKDMNRCTEHASVTEILQRSRKNPVGLEECFELFRTPENLEKENAWFCPSCKTHVQATKKLEIYKAPPILIIHIKRFKVNGHTKEKLYNPVDFPQQGLNIEKWVLGSEENRLYDLYAVCNHFGNLAGGHYTATCFSSINKQWFDFKDSQVLPAVDTNNAASAYVLFYRARRK